MSNNKHILTTMAERLTMVFDEVSEIYGAPGNLAEILAIEMLLLSMRQNAPMQTAAYLNALAEELPRTDFDDARMVSARTQLLDALKAH